MKIEDIVTNIEIAKTLSKLGLNGNTIYTFAYLHDGIRGRDFTSDFRIAYKYNDD